MTDKHSVHCFRRITLLWDVSNLATEENHGLMIWHYLQTDATFVVSRVRSALVFSFQSFVQANITNITVKRSVPVDSAIWKKNCFFMNLQALHNSITLSLAVCGKLQVLHPPTKVRFSFCRFIVNLRISPPLPLPPPPSNKCSPPLPSFCGRVMRQRRMHTFRNVVLDLHFVSVCEHV